MGKATADSLTPTNPGTMQPHKSMADLQSPVTITEEQYQALKGKVSEQVQVNASSAKGYRTAARLLKSDYNRNNAFYGVKGYARQAIKYAAKSAKLLAGFGTYAQGKRRTFAAADAYMDDYQNYQSLLAEWEKGDKNHDDKPIEPQYRTFIQSSFTMEAVCAQFQRQGNRGITFFYDELSAHFAAMNQYRNGDDKETWLQFYDGNISPKLRMKSDDKLGGSLMTGNNFNCQMGIIGSIQPEVFQDLLSQTNLRSAGHFARFNYLWMESKPLTLEEVISGGSAVDVTEDIYKLLGWAVQLPGQKFVFSPDAFKYIVSKISLMETKAMEENNQIMAEFLNKFPGKFLRHCGLLHLLFSYPNEPTNLIPWSVCQVAFDSIAQQQYFIEKVCLLKPEPTLSDTMKKILQYCQEKDNFISARDVLQLRYFRSLKPKLEATTIRQYFLDFEKMGLGQTQYQNKRKDSLVFKALDNKKS